MREKYVTIPQRSLFGLARRPMRGIVGETSSLLSVMARGDIANNKPLDAAKRYQSAADMFAFRGIAGAIADIAITGATLEINKLMNGINLFNLPESISNLLQHPTGNSLAGAALLAFAGYRLLTRPWRTGSYLYVSNLFEEQARKLS